MTSVKSLDFTAVRHLTNKTVDCLSLGTSQYLWRNGADVFVEFSSKKFSDPIVWHDPNFKLTPCMLFQHINADPVLN